MRAKSLRAELIAWLMVPLTAVVLFNVWATHESAIETANLINDRMLLASARVIAEQLQVNDGHVEVLIPPSALEMFVSDHRERVLYHVTAPSGQLIAGHPELVAPAAISETTEAHYFEAMFRNEPIRAVAIAQLIPALPSAGPGIVVVADTLHGRDALVTGLWLRALRDQVLIVASACLLAVLGLHHALRTVTRLHDLILAHDPRSTERLAAETVAVEFQPLVQSLNEAFARTERYVETQRRFIANASHQLRTPLAVLQTQAHVGQRESDPACKDEALRAISAGVDKLTRVANQLLTLARAEPGGDQLLMADLDFAHLTRDVLERMASLALERQMDLAFVASNEPSFVHGHETLLREIIINLVDNAIRYTPSGGAVTVEVQNRPAGVILRVEDTGPGIAPAERDHVFERFYRILGSGVEGTGLGLAIVREIAMAHGGGVRLSERSPPPGLVAEVELPRLAVASWPLREATHDGGPITGFRSGVAGANARAAVPPAP